MGHHCDYIERIDIEYDYETSQRYLVRVVNANYKKHSLDVYKELEPGTYYGDDRFFARNIEFCTMGGYLVTFPGEKISRSYYYYGGCNSQIAKLDDWENTSPLGIYGYDTINYDSEKNILELYPGFKYVLKKMKPEDKRVYRVFHLLQVWKEHPEIEGLCQLGFYDIALNKSLFKLGDKKRKQIIKWIMENQSLILYPEYMKLVHIQKMIKYKVGIGEFKDYQMHVPCIRTWRPDIPTYFYLKKHLEGSLYDTAVLYRDYLDMAIQVGHDIEDKYWKYPSSIGKAHAKVMEELANVKATVNALQGDYLKAVMQPLADKFNAKVDGYDIFLPTNIETVQKQCDTLYQCLLRNNYVNKVLLQEEILVFIWKDGVPQATAEVFYDKKLGQFYGDESGHRRGESCAPSEPVEKAFQKWFETFKPYKVKAERKKANKRFYKGFHSVDKNGIYHTSFGNFEFEVGKTYTTPFSDNEILARGGDACVATNKVFHFCDSIDEIYIHYNPTCFAEVEPLGPIVECNGALLSNRIKIVRALSNEEAALLRTNI